MRLAVTDNGDIFAGDQPFFGQPEHQLILRAFGAFIVEPPAAAGPVDQLTDAAVEVTHHPAADRMILQACRIDARVLAQRGDEGVAVRRITMWVARFARELHDDATEGGGKLTGHDDLLKGLERGGTAMGVGRVGRNARMAV